MPAPAITTMPLSFTSAIPYFAISIIVLLFAELLARIIPFYRNLIKHENDGRYEALDGLRGFLALGVFFQHAVTNHFYFDTGVWQITDVKFYRHLGGEAVIIFFMITSFLYWSKAISKKGNLDAGALYKSRFFRLAPMYLFSAAIVTFFALATTGFTIGSVTGFARDVLSWLTLGLVTTTSVNGITIIPINAGIHWTLHFEWFFYLALPFLAFVLRKSSVAFLSLPIFACALLAPGKGYWMIFFFGILAAHVVNRFPSMPFLKHWLAGVLPIAGMALVYVISYKPYSLLQYAITFFIFLCFVYGNDLFGLLKTKAAKFLGAMSYSVYLMHGIILYIVLTSTNFFYPIKDMTPLNYWLLIFVSALLTVLCSAVTYRYIEHPFIRKVSAKKPEEAVTEKVM